MTGNGQSLYLAIGKIDANMDAMRHQLTRTEQITLNSHRDIQTIKTAVRHIQTQASKTDTDISLKSALDTLKTGATIILLVMAFIATILGQATVPTLQTILGLPG